MKTALLPLLLLAGCASQPQMSLEEVTARASNVDVCEVVFFAPPAGSQYAQAEAQRRGINCQDYMQAVTAVRQQRAQAASAYVQPLVIPPVPVYQMPQQRTRICNSYRFGNSIQTTCN